MYVGEVIGGVGRGGEMSILSRGVGGRMFSGTSCIH
jgi:hypothetical protein